VRLLVVPRDCVFRPGGGVELGVAYIRLLLDARVIRVHGPGRVQANRRLCAHVVEHGKIDRGGPWVLCAEMTL